MFDCRVSMAGQDRATNRPFLYDHGTHPSRQREALCRIADSQDPGVRAQQSGVPRLFACRKRSNPVERRFTPEFARCVG